MKIKHLFLSVLAMASVAVACDKENQNSGKPSLKLDPATVEFEATAGTKTVKVDANQAWAIDGNDYDWVTLSQEEGDGAADVEITVLENTSAAARTASITFRCSIVKKTLKITQTGIGEPIGEGEGTKEKPYSASQANTVASALAADAFSAAPVYVEGIVVSFKDAENTVSKYGSLTIYISDDGTATNQFYVYALKGVNGAAFTSTNPFAVGDRVVVYGYLQNYKGNTPEMTRTSEGVAPQLVTVNGKVPGGTTPDPTPGEKPELKKVTIADFLAASVSTTVWYELTGTIIDIANTTYGNFTLKDETGEVYVYGLVENYVTSGNDQSFSKIGLAVGDNITIGTLRSEYNGTAQAGGSTVAAFFVSKNGVSNYLKVNTARVAVGAAATTASISVSSNTDWTVECSGTWVKDYTKSGNGEGSVELSFDANTTSADRTATITIKSSDASLEVYTVELIQGKAGEAGALKTDVLTSALFAASSTTYTDFTGAAGSASSAVYAGNSAKSNTGAIQIRSKNSAGIVTTKSGGNIRKVVVVWDDATSKKGDRTLDVYGSATAYSSAADLYDSTKQGTKLGSITCGTETELEIPAGDYAFVGLRSQNGAMYITSIALSFE